MNAQNSAARPSAEMRDQSFRKESYAGPGVGLEVSPTAAMLTDALRNVERGGMGPLGGGGPNALRNVEWGAAWQARGGGRTSSQMCSEKMTDRMPVDGYRPWPCSQLSKTYLMKAG